jgi:hypothetical protein
LAGPDPFEEEQPRLLKLPNPMPNVDLTTPVTVDKTAFIRFNTNRYSVPPQYVRKTVSLVANDQHVRLFNGADPIAVHLRNWGRHQIIELPEHRKTILETKHRGTAPKGQDRLRVEVPNIEPLFERWFESGHNIGGMTIKTLHLLDLYGSAILTDAVGEMDKRGTYDPGALAIVCDQIRRRNTATPAPIPLALGKHVVERDVRQHDLGGYDG